MGTSQVTEPKADRPISPLGPRCTVCSHPSISTINMLLADGSMSERGIAKRYALNDSAIHRHNAAHVPVKLVKAAERRDAKEADEFLEGILSAARAGAKGVSHGMAALDAGQVDPELAYRMTPAFMAQQLRALELLGQATGRLNQAPAPAGNVYLSVIIPRPADLAGARIDTQIDTAAECIETTATDCTPPSGVLPPSE